MNQPHQQRAPKLWNIGEAIAAWLVPGAGHFLLGERRRGTILFISISSLWLAGLLIAGVGVFDRVQHPAWFYLGQAFVAPSIAADITLQTMRGGHTDPKPAPDSDPDSTPENAPAYEPSFGRVNEQGLLYTSLTGLLNLLAIMDVIYRDPRRRRLDTPGNETAPATGGGA